MSSTRLGEHAVRKFAGHETFAPRFGWLRKAYREVAKNTAALGVEQSEGHQGSDIFLRKTATVELGVGKNMVNAIRYWAQAFGVTREAAAGGTSRALLAHPTGAGRWLFDDDGADPWLEDPASLWLLHWWLLRDKSLAPTWWVAFHALPTARFSEDQLAATVATHIALAGWEPVMTASIMKDVDCLTKMYAPRRSATGSPGSVEDLLDCPFRELGILESVPDAAKTWRFAATPRLQVPAAIVAYAALDYMRIHGLPKRVTLARLAHEPGAVGLAFRLSEPALAIALQEIAGALEGVSVSEAVGQRSLVIEGDPAELAWQVLAAHYGHPDMGVPPDDERGAVAANLPGAEKASPSRSGTTSSPRAKTSASKSRKVAS